MGCVHCRISFELTSADGIAKYRRFMVEAARLICEKYGGSISGEHGDGQARGELLEIMFGADLVQAFREFKAIWDPDGRMNREKSSTRARSMPICGWARTTIPHDPRRFSRFRAIRAVSPTPRCAAWASVSVVACAGKASKTRCARALWSLARNAIRRAVARIYCGRCSVRTKRRSTHVFATTT